MNRKIKLKISAAILMLLILMSGLTNAQKDCSVILTIKDGGKDTVYLKMDNNYLGDRYDVMKMPSSGGNKAFTFKLDRDRVVELSYKDQSMKIYIEPGDDIAIDVPSGELDSTVVFLGKTAPNNEFLYKFNTKFKKDYDTAMLKDKILNDGIDPLENFLFDS